MAEEGAEELSQFLRVYVPANGRVYVPTEDPDWWRDENLCEESCHHPVHAFGRPQRLYHLESFTVIHGEGVPAEASSPTS